MSFDTKAFDQLREPAYATPQTGYNYIKPPTNESRRCDIKWCCVD
jgi:hypothetical protein